MSEKDTAIQQFIQLLSAALAQKNLIKLSLSKGAEGCAQKILGRPIALKKGLALQATYRYPTQDKVKNYLLAELEQQLQAWLKDYKAAYMKTTTEEIQLLFNRRGKARLQRKKMAQKAAPAPLSHNRKKQYLITADRPFLQALGITDAKGRVKDKQQDKFRQINKYVEIMQAQLEQTNLLGQKENLRIVDMGSGKGYLSFALVDFLMQQGQEVELLGVELRPELVEFCQQLSHRLGWQQNIRFMAMDIADFPKELKIDVLIALHACNLATDYALHKGLLQGAELLVVAPCCHKEVRQQIQAVAPQWRFPLKQGIFQERQAELLTDSIRALLLEHQGYQAKAFEFISGQHTAKNLMLAAQKRPQGIESEEQDRILVELQTLAAEFGIKEQELAKRLGIALV